MLGENIVSIEGTGNHEDDYRFAISGDLIVWELSVDCMGSHLGWKIEVVFLALFWFWNT